MTIEYVQARPTRPTSADSASSAAQHEPRALTTALTTGGTAIGCPTGWVAITGIFAAAVVIGIICIGGTAALLAAAFLAP